jgi:hypothetical protein
MAVDLRLLLSGIFNTQKLFLAAVMYNCFSQDLIQLYGQSAIFADLSVNGSHFAKCSALNQCVKLSVKFTAGLFSVISVIASDCHAYEKNGSDLQFETS